MAMINLYGSKLDLRPVWFLSQGYCQMTTDEGMKLAEAGQWSPEASVEWMKQHTLVCEQCRMANLVKNTIIEFLQEFYPDLVLPYKQGANLGSTVIVGWMGFVRGRHPVVYAWFATEMMSLIGPHAEEFTRLYGGRGVA